MIIAGIMVILAVVAAGATIEDVIPDKDVTITSGKSLVGTDSFQVFVSKSQTV